MRHTRTPIAAVLCLLMVLPAALMAGCSSGPEAPRSIRVATFNVGDLRTTDLRDPENLRATALAEVIRQVDADILLLTNITHDRHGVAGASGADPEGSNATRLARVFVSVDPNAPGSVGTEYAAIMPEVNSGRASGRDLNRDGLIATFYPEPATSRLDGARPPPDPRALNYALDAWGYGEYPGQRGMAVLLRKKQTLGENRYDLSRAAGELRTFTGFPWASMPDAPRPIDPMTDREFYDFDTWQRIPLFQSGAAMFPVELPKMDRFWVVCLYAGPTTGDGADLRSTYRRYAEARFVRDLLDAAPYVEDDAFARVPPELLDEPVIVLADLGIDPDEPPKAINPASLLAGHPRYLGLPTPTGPGPASLQPDDTARDGGRLDLVLVDRAHGLSVEDAGVERTPPEGLVAFPSPRFPVWVDVRLGD